jgi:para-aminobenzoate synthetase
LLTQSCFNCNFNLPSISAQVPSLMELKTYSSVHHLVSTVTGQLATSPQNARPRTDGNGVDGDSVGNGDGDVDGDSSCDALAAVAACWPPGSMTGAPKVRTMRIIDELEQKPRGAYSGALGYLSVSGAVDLSVLIRTATVERKGVSLGAGGAIVSLSETSREWKEVLLKASTVMRGVAAAVSDGDDKVMIA